MDYKLNFQEIYNSLEPHNIYPGLDIVDSYQCILKAAFAKSVQFNFFLQNDPTPENSFFYTPFLRGLCEDLITMKYLQKHLKSDRHEIIMAFSTYLLSCSLEAQTIFLNKEAPQQISLVADIKNLSSKNHELLLKDLMAKVGLNKGDNSITFSSLNFYKYYEQFNKFYAAYLFIEFAKSFKEELSFSSSISISIKKLRSHFTKQSFYPELVTFEELNKKRPSDFWKMFTLEESK
jgi:hypothetical protein